MKRILILLTLLLGNYAHACSCSIPNIEESFNNADFVYIGLIQSAKLTDEAEITNYVSIVKEFKGVRDTDILLSHNSESSCAAPAAVGYKYLIFGKFGETPILESCSPNQTFFEGRYDLLDELNELSGNNKHGS